MSSPHALTRKVTALLSRHGWDIEYFKGFVLGLVWLDLFREDSRYEAFLDLPEGTLTPEEDRLLDQFASKISMDVEMERFRFSTGCQVDEKNFAANYKRDCKLFQWANGVHMACRILEVMVEDGDVELNNDLSYLLERIAESVYPFMDKKFATEFFSELNEQKLTTPECAHLLARLRQDLPRLIRDITVSAQMLSLGEANAGDLDDDPNFDVPNGPIQSVHAYFAGVKEPDELLERVDYLLPHIMEGPKGNRVKHMEAALSYAEKALGEEYFKENEGHFWGLLETRPYMRALTALAEAYKSTLQRDKAIQCYEKALLLCSGDNLGVRYLLCELYMELRQFDNCLALAERFKEDRCAMMLFTKALALFMKHGNGPASAKALKDAVKSNQHVVAYLTDAQAMPEELPSYYGYGDDAEAVLYVAQCRLLWRNSPGAMAWLENSVPVAKSAGR